MRNLLAVLVLLILLSIGCAQTATTPTTSPPMSKPINESPPPAEQPPPEIMPPPVPVLPKPAVETPTSFEFQRYSNADYGFSIRYPKAWASWEPPLSTNVLLASAIKGQPDKLGVVVDIRKADNLKNASHDLVYELIRWKSSFSAPPIAFDIVNENSGTTGKDKLAAYDVFWQVAGYRIYCNSALKDGKAITVLAGWDEPQSDLYKEITQTLTFE